MAFQSLHTYTSGICARIYRFFLLLVSFLFIISISIFSSSFLSVRLSVPEYDGGIVNLGEAEKVRESK